MRIQDIDTGIKKILNENEKVNKKKAKNIKENGNASEDKVNFSDTLKEAEKLVIDILDYPENRTEKIEKLKEMIRSGNYNVDVHKLADKIVEDLIFGNFYK
jgi:flagellar biosynthesis anti-sigma factor FlgM